MLVNDRRVNWPLLVVAALCLVPVVGGVLLVLQEGGAALGWGLIGFFGAGVVVLARKALTGS